MDNFAYAKWLREQAEEFRRRAKAIDEKQTKASFLRLAKSYDGLAEAEEARAEQRK